MRVYRKVEQYIECDLAITSATLLSIEEAEQLPRELRKYDHWWWLRSPGFYSDFAVLVDLVGSVYDRGNIVRSDDIAVRPVLLINNLKSSNLKVGDVFEFGGKQFKIVSDKLAFCLTDIGAYCFREDWQAEDANDYEKSDVKKYVDEWFNDTVKSEVESHGTC